jgi:hypothetical protein
MDAEEQVNAIMRAAAIESAREMLVQMQYEYDVLTGKLPMPAPQPLRIPFTIRKPDGV